MTNSQIIETVNQIPACFAREVDRNEIKVTYRGKKSDVVTIDTEYKAVSFSGNIESIAIQISKAIDYTIN